MENRVKNVVKNPVSGGNGKGPKIYLLPNLMTAGNLFCGFAAVLKIIEAALMLQADGDPVRLYHEAIAFILGACVFDLLDGRLARLGGCESPFGREFDSLADIVSFGLAPALMTYQIVLADFEKIGGVLAFLYLVCGALRLARFNCVAADSETGGSKEFQGFPIPAAAGLIASLTLFMLWMNEGQRDLGAARWVLPPLMLFLSFMMFSHVKYPSFKGFNWRTQRSIPRFLMIIVIIVFAAMYYEWAPALIFVAFLIYGFVRPFISNSLRKELEEEADAEETEDS
ncbi:MAG: CDP-diacylglycerol--serine O-phosphatidyltransferase [Chthoniobacterales bacterium]